MDKLLLIKVLLGGVFLGGFLGILITLQLVQWRRQREQAALQKMFQSSQLRDDNEK